MEQEGEAKVGLDETNWTDLPSEITLGDGSLRSLYGPQLPQLLRVTVHSRSGLRAYLAVEGIYTRISLQREI